MTIKAASSQDMRDADAWTASNIERLRDLSGAASNAEWSERTTAARKHWSEFDALLDQLKLAADQAAAQRKGLEEALTPFAELADSWSATFSDALKLSCDESNNGDSTYAFTLGDLRRAYAALHPEGKSETSEPNPSEAVRI